MRRHVFAISLLLASGFAVPALAQTPSCAQQVEAAFEKQRTQAGYRVVSRQPSPRGEIETTTDYVAPDKMASKVVVPGEPAPLETIAVGRWAWANQGGGFQELQPQFAQSVTFHVTQTLSTPVQVSAPFTCLGTVTRDGRQLTAYQSDPSATLGKPVGPENPMIARTVYVDPATGLPVLNIVSEVKPDAPALTSAAFSYPADLKVESPDAVPASRTR